MSRVWKIVLLVVAVLVLAVVGLRVLGGGKDKAAGRKQAPARAVKIPMPARCR